MAELLPDKTQKVQLENVLSCISSLGGADTELHPTLWHVLAAMGVQAVAAYDAGQDLTPEVVTAKVVESLASSGGAPGSLKEVQSLKAKVKELESAKKAAESESAYLRAKGEAPSPLHSESQLEKLDIEALRKMAAEVEPKVKWRGELMGVKSGAAGTAEPLVVSAAASAASAPIPAPTPAPVPTSAQQHRKWGVPSGATLLHYHRQSTAEQCLTAVP